MIEVLGQLYSSKNSREIWRVRGDRSVKIGKSQKAKGQEKDFALQLNPQRAAFKKEIESIPPPAALVFQIYRQDNSIFDYVNIVQGLLDAMVRAQLLEDDNANCVIPYFMPYQVAPDNVRTRVWACANNPSSVLMLMEKITCHGEKDWRFNFRKVDDFHSREGLVSL